MHIGYTVMAGLDPAIHVSLDEIPRSRNVRPGMVD